MKIGIIGSGNMGRFLDILWAEQEHEVFFGVRDVEKARARILSVSIPNRDFDELQ